MPFPPACRGKGYFRAPSECSRRPFPPACRGKSNFRAPPGGPRAALFGRFWMPALTPRDCLFPLLIEEHAISVLPGNARDGLSSLPVEEKAISGSTGRPKSGPFRMILDAGFDPSRLPLPPWGDEKVTREAAVASSRLPFPSQGERKGHRKLSQTPLPETPEAPRKRQPGPPQSSLAMDFIPRGPFSSLSLTVRSLPCFRLGASQAPLWSQRVPSFCVAPRLT